MEIEIRPRKGDILGVVRPNKMRWDSMTVYMPQKGLFNRQYRHGAKEIIQSSMTA